MHAPPAVSFTVSGSSECGLSAKTASNVDTAVGLSPSLHNSGTYRGSSMVGNVGK